MIVGCPEFNGKNAYAVNKPIISKANISDKPYVKAINIWNAANIANPTMLISFHLIDPNIKSSIRDKPEDI